MAQLDQVAFIGLAGQSVEREINFNPDVNVFWGPNGCGKTSLLKVLHSALSGDARYLVRVPIKSAEVKLHSESKRYTRTLIDEPSKSAEEVVLMDDGMYRVVGGEDAYRRRTGESLKHFRWRTHPRVPKAQGFAHQYLPVSRVSPSRSTRRIGDRIDVFDEASFDRVFADGIRSTWRDYSTTQLVAVRDIQGNGLAEILKGVIDRAPDEDDIYERLDAKAALTAVESYFESRRMGRIESRDRFIEAYETDSVQRKIVAEIVRIQARLTEAQKPARRVEALLGDLFTGGKSVSLTANEMIVYARDKSQIPISALSSGEKQMVRLLVESLAAGSNTVIIDEPEISMHVDWQHRLIESMTLVNPNAQIVVATHSPEVMAELDDEKIFEL